MGYPIEAVLRKWPQKHVWVKRQVSCGTGREGPKKLHRDRGPLALSGPVSGPLQLVALPSTAPCGPRAGSCARLKCNQWRLNPVPHNQPEPPHNHCHAVKTRKTHQSSLRIQVLSHGHQVGIWGHVKKILAPYCRAFEAKKNVHSSLTWASGRHLRSLNSLPKTLEIWRTNRLKVFDFDFHSWIKPSNRQDVFGITSTVNKMLLLSWIWRIWPSVSWSMASQWEYI